MGAQNTRMSLRSWIAACTAGEILGFGAAALWAFLALTLFGMDPVSPGARAGFLGLMVVAGLFEGLVLGSLQWLVLRRRFRRLRALHWTGATAAMAALGWFLGMLPQALREPAAAGAGAAWEPPAVLILAGAAGFGAVIGAAFGLAQWLVLRRHARGAARWIPANALGWAMGLPWAFVAGNLGDLTASVPLAVALSALAGLLMGLSVAVVTGLALRRIQPLELRP
jgi:uncharacterized integral membrane protein